MSLIDYAYQPLNIKSDQFRQPQNSVDSEQDLHVQYPNSSIFSDMRASFFFQPDRLFDWDPKTKAIRLFKLRMYRLTDYTSTCPSPCRIGYMILRNSADGSSNHERVGWARFEARLIDDVAFPEFLHGETEEVITII